jgi:hypothetical protein
MSGNDAPHYLASRNGTLNPFTSCPIPNGGPLSSHPPNLDAFRHGQRLRKSTSTCFNAARESLRNASPPCQPYAIDSERKIGRRETSTPVPRHPDIQGTPNASRSSSTSICNAPPRSHTSSTGTCITREHAASQTDVTRFNSPSGNVRARHDNDVSRRSTETMRSPNETEINQQGTTRPNSPQRTTRSNSPDTLLWAETSNRIPLDKGASRAKSEGGPDTGPVNVYQEAIAKWERLIESGNNWGPPSPDQNSQSCSQSSSSSDLALPQPGLLVEGSFVVQKVRL